MTPEERWTRIENLLATLMEHQVAAEVQIEKNATQIKENASQIKEVATETEKNTAAIRDLIKISGALIESQKSTDETLSGLINGVGRLEGTVDRMATKIDKIGDMWERFLKSRGGPNGNV